MSWKDRAKPVDTPQPATGWRGRARPAAPVEIRQGEQVSTFSPSSSSGAVLRGFGQGASFGLSDELAGAANAYLAAGAKLREMVGTESPEEAQAFIEALGGAGGRGLLDTITNTYRKTRDETRKENKQASDESPYLYGGAELAGGLLAPIPGKVPLKAGGTLAKAIAAGQRFAGVPVAPAASTVLGRLASTAGQGVKLGALAGFGHSQGDTVGEVAGDVAAGGATGGVLGGALSVGGDAARRFLPGALSRLAEDMAVRSTTRAGIGNKLATALKDKNLNETKIRAFGRKLLDQKLLGSTPAQTLEKSLAVLDDTGEGIGDMIAKREAAAASGAADPASLLQGRLAMKVGMAPELAASPVRQSVGPAIVDDVAQKLGFNPGQAEPPTTFRKLWQAKVDLQKNLKPQDSTKLQDELYRKAIGKYTANVYDQMAAGLSPDDAAALKDMASRYATAAQARQLLADEVSRGAARSPVGLLDTQIASALSPGSGPVAALIGATSAALRSRAPAAIAKGSDAFSKALLRNPKAGPVAEYLSPTKALIDYLRARAEENAQ